MIESLRARVDAQLPERILYEVKKVVVGQDHFLERVLVAILAQGHLLVEGVPGLAKTLTVKTLARTIRGTFKRIQFTPDLVPADLTGTRIFNQKTGDFATSLGPVFANLLLADEINRAPAKVQSALLEVMQEYQVTIAGETHKVPSPFLVMATQNPIESEGTYPLPEAQVDRFMMKVLVGYPTEEEEFVIVDRVTGTPGQVSPVATTEQLAELQQACRAVYVDPSCIQYAVRLAAVTRFPDRHGLPELARFVHLRREPARADPPDRRRARAGLPARPRLRAARGRDGPRARRLPPPAGAVLRGARGIAHRPTSCCAGSCRRYPRPRSRWRPMSASPPPAEAVLRRLEWTVMRRLDGLLHGDYRTLFRGSGLDLADLREYQYHDDVRHIDWNVTARMQQPFVRTFNEERDLTAWFLLDLSPSLDFGSGALAKRAGRGRVRGRARAAVHAPRQSRRRAVLRRDRGHRDPGAHRPPARAAAAASHARPRRRPTPRRPPTSASSSPRPARS